VEGAGVRVIGHLCDHHADLYRESVTRDALGDTVIVWTLQDSPEGENCRPNQNWSGTLQDHGPGEQQDARRQWFLLGGTWDPRERDVLQIVSGQEAGALLRIGSVTRTTAPRGLHHYEVNVEVWTGSLT
jgi:hypothetical protein